MTDIQNSPPVGEASPSGHSKRLLIGSYTAESICVIAATFLCSLIMMKLINTTSSSLTFGPVAFSETFRPAPTVQVASAPTPALSTFFRNGSAAISSEDKSVLSRIAAALEECAGLKIVAVGSSSSTPYQQDRSDEKNVLLANQRAENVAKFLRSAGRRLDVTAEKVPSIKRRYYDVRTSENIPRMTEALNRRVDLLFNNVDCTSASPVVGD